MLEAGHSCTQISSIEASSTSTSVREAGSEAAASEPVGASTHQLHIHEWILLEAQHPGRGGDQFARRECHIPAGRQASWTPSNPQSDRWRMPVLRPASAKGVAPPAAGPGPARREVRRKHNRLTRRAALPKLGAKKDKSPKSTRFDLSKSAHQVYGGSEAGSPTVRPKAGAKYDRSPKSIRLLSSMSYITAYSSVAAAGQFGHGGAGAHQLRLPVGQRELHVVRTNVASTSSTGTWSLPVDANRTRASST